jgi:hypothetical protein
MGSIFLGSPANLTLFLLIPGVDTVGDASMVGPTDDREQSGLRVGHDHRIRLEDPLKEQSSYMKSIVHYNVTILYRHKNN